jgi:hypothetical protein
MGASGVRRMPGAVEPPLEAYVDSGRRATGEPWPTQPRFRNTSPPTTS